MLKNHSILFTLRLLCFAAVSGALAACGGGSGASGSALPPGAAGVAGAPLAASTATVPTAVQSANGSAYAPKSINVTFPGTPAAGHVLVVAFWNNGNSSGGAIKYAAPSGWSLVDANFAHSYHTYEVFSHVVQSGESNNYVFTPTYTQREHVWTAIEVANAAGIDKHGNAYVSGSTFTTPTLYPSHASDLAIAFNMPQATGATWSNASAWTREVGPTSTWSGEGVLQNLSSTSAISESATLSTSSTGFAGIVLVSPSQQTSTPTPAPSATSSPISSVSGTAGTPSVAQWANGSAYKPSSITVKYASAPAAGHLLVVAFWNNGQSTGGANTYAAPAGWTLVNQNTSHAYLTYQVFSHVVAAGEANAYVFKPLSAQREHVWIAADSTASSVDTSGNNFINNSTSFTTPSLAPAQSNELALALNLPEKNGSLTWSNPTGWAAGAGPTSMWHGEAVTAAQSSTASVSESARLSAASSGFAGMVLLSPSQSSGAAPTSAPTTSPTSSPTSVPVSSAVATYHGCPLYTANDWFTTNLISGGSSYVSNAVDANSSKIINNLNSAFPTLHFSANVPANQEVANIYTGSNLAAQPTIQGLAYGFAKGSYNDDPSGTIWVTNPWAEEGGSSFCSSGSGECHAVVLNTQTCVDIETYKSGTYGNGIGLEWDSAKGQYWAEGGGVENLNHPYQIEPIAVSEADLPMMGTTDWGEDLSYQQQSCQPNCAIPHILAFFLPSATNAHGGWVAPANYGHSCSTNCSSPIPSGARLRLHSTYACPSASSYPQANLLCNQAKQYGWILNDFTGINNGGGVRLGESSNGANPWNSSDYNQFLANVKVTDFDVMELGTIK